jgi:hypothetical protein
MGWRLIDEGPSDDYIGPGDGRHQEGGQFVDADVAVKTAISMADERQHVIRLGKTVWPSH